MDSVKDSIPDEKIYIKIFISRFLFGKIGLYW